MKTIKLLKEDKELLTNIVGNAPAGGSMELKEVRKAVKVLDKLVLDNEETTFEDAEFDYLKERFSTTKFLIANTKITTLADKLGL